MRSSRIHTAGKQTPKVGHPLGSLTLGIAGTVLLSIVIACFSSASARRCSGEVVISRSEGSPASGVTINVPADADFQAALNAANPGDTIVLQAGASYVGSYKLPNKTGDSYVTVTTSALASLPAERNRISPSHSQFLPKLLAPKADPALVAANGGHHYRFVGIEFAPAPTVKFLYDLVRIGLGNETDPSTLPHDIVFDRVYIHGNPAMEVRRGIGLNGAAITVENSYISDIKGLGQDTQAIEGWNGPGPFRIINNYLEAAGENIMFGGARASIQNLVPADIEVRHNYLRKPLSWKKGDPGYAGMPWTVKNLFELKNAQRVTVDGNVMENDWTMAQTGVGVLFTPRAEEGRMPWAVVQDVTFTHNIVRHVAGGISFLGIDDTDKTTRGLVRLHRVLVKDNLFLDVSSANWIGYGMLYGIFSGPDSITIDHNTGFSDGFVALADGAPSAKFTLTNNIALHAEHGFVGSGTVEGTATLAKYFPGAVFAKNLIVGGNATLYPSANFFPGSPSDVGFISYAEGDYRLRPSSRYRNAGTDGRALGADFDDLNMATAGVVEGKPLSGPARRP